MTFKVGDVVDVEFAWQDGYTRYLQYRQDRPFRGEILRIRYGPEGTVAIADFLVMTVGGDGNMWTHVERDCCNVTLTEPKEDE